MAWLHAFPEGKKKPRGQTIDLEAFRFPPVEFGEHLLSMMQSIGYASGGFNGAQPVSWTDIKHWQEVTDQELTLWEASTLMSLSADYASTLHKAKDPNCPQPYRVETDDEAQQRREQVDSFFRKLGKSQSRKGMKNG